MREKKARELLFSFLVHALLCAEIGGLTGNKQANNEAEETQNGTEDFNNQNFDEAVIDKDALVT